jgi:ornithine--oxo-acid transaminase
MSHIAKNYKTFLNYDKSIVIYRAIGCKFYDKNSNSYIDATSSYCSANLGHNHPYFKAHIVDQINKISVCPRYIENIQLNNLGKIVNKYLKDKINISKSDTLQILPSCNGVDTIETAIKLSRAWAYEKKGISVGESIQIFFDGNFHGRTVSALSVSNSKYQEKFHPKNPNLITVPFNNFEYLEDLLSKTKNISAVFIEPIQCEGGINIPNYNFLFKIRELCNKHNILLVCDEIQTGLFRTGKILCSEKFNCKPDIVLLGKSLGAGYIPISLTIASNKIMDCIKPGEHGSTFGGNPLACNIASNMLDYLYKYNYEKKVNDLSYYIINNLNLIKNEYGFIKEIRNEGLLYGIEIDEKISAEEICNKLVNYNIIIKSTNRNTIRLSPPFIMKKYEIDELFDGFTKCFNKL